MWGWGNGSDFYSCFLGFFHDFLYIYWYRLSQNSVICAFKKNTFFWNIDAYIFKIKFYVDLHFFVLGSILRNRPLVWSLRLSSYVCCTLKLTTLRLSPGSHGPCPPAPDLRYSRLCWLELPPCFLSLPLLSDIFACLSPSLRKRLSLLVLEDSSYSCR